MTREELIDIAHKRAEECKANMYKSESKVWELLLTHNNLLDLDWQTQVPIIIPYDLKQEYDSKAFYIADFIEESRGIIIEVDGEQHDKYSDSVRDAVLEDLGYTTYRIKSLDVWKKHELMNFILNIYRKEDIL